MGWFPILLRVIPTRIGYNGLMKRKILVVDDTRNVLVLLSDYLESQDFEVLAAADGRQPLEAV
jgi:CheY-like chemotaxis protein